LPARHGRSVGGKDALAPAIGAFACRNNTRVGDVRADHSVLADEDMVNGGPEE
jgi:hypothetical protein